MATWVLPMLLGAGMTALAIMALLPVARRIGWVDHPGGRKQHCTPTPTIGGVGIAVGLFISMLVVRGGAGEAVLAFAAPAALLIMVGILDDLFDVHWLLRILSQVAAALMMVYAGGVQVEYVGQLPFAASVLPAYLAVPLTVVATVGLINAVNMTDGADGLAGGQCAATFAMLACAAAYSGNHALLFTIMPMLGALLAFLAFNVRHAGQRRARVFLGNAGSTLLGFTVAWEVFRLTQNPAHPVSPVLTLWLFAPPVIDCLVLIARRLRMGKSPFLADRGHVHHLMLDAGFTPNQLLCTLVAVSLACGLGAGLMLRSDAVTETHLIALMGVALVGYYWLTSRRGRAIRAFRGLRSLLFGARRPGVTAMVGTGDNGETQAAAD